jgi:hypothetical protein
MVRFILFLFLYITYHCIIGSVNIIVFGLTRYGLEPTIYRIRGKHANHDTTDAVITKSIHSAYTDN